MVNANLLLRVLALFRDDGDLLGGVSPAVEGGVGSNLSSDAKFAAVFHSNWEVDLVVLSVRLIVDVDDSSVGVEVGDASREYVIGSGYGEYGDLFCVSVLTARHEDHADERTGADVCCGSLTRLAAKLGVWGDAEGDGRIRELVDETDGVGARVVVFDLSGGFNGSHVGDDPEVASEDPWSDQHGVGVNAIAFLNAEDRGFMRVAINMCALIKLDGHLFPAPERLDHYVVANAIHL